MSGPIASPMPEAAAHAVMTSVRRCGSVKVAPRIARLFGQDQGPAEAGDQLPDDHPGHGGAPATTAAPTIMARTPAPNMRLRP